jgi:hypothetical protein
VGARPPLAWVTKQTLRGVPFRFIRIKNPGPGDVFVRGVRAYGGGYGVFKTQSVGDLAFKPDVHVLLRRGPLDADPLARPLTQSCGQLPLLPSTRLAAWRADAEARERAFKREREQRKQRDEEHVRQMTQADENRNAWADGKIAAALEALAFNDFQVEILGMTIAEERKLMRKEFAAEIDKLRQEFLAVNKIVDLPSPLIRKVRDNAA